MLNIFIIIASIVIVFVIGFLSAVFYLHRKQYNSALDDQRVNMDLRNIKNWIDQYIEETYKYEDEDDYPREIKNIKSTVERLLKISKY